MSKLKIKNGTPVGNANLCNRCSWGQCMKGYRDSDRLVLCNRSTPAMVVPFTVLECTCFDDKHRPDWQQMQKLAIDVQPVRVSARTAGFSMLTDSRNVSVSAEEEFEDEAARDETTSQ